MTNLPPPPKRGSFWNLGGEQDIWTVGVKLLVWGAVLGFGVWIAYALGTS